MADLKKYIGYGIYADYRERTNMICIFTSDGVSSDNQIFFEPVEIAALLDFFKACDMRN